MKNDLTYNEAFSKLELIIEQLEDGNIPLEKLALKVKQAYELITICETSLRTIDDRVKQITNSSTSQSKKKRS